jgi:hypothetical protein
MKREIAYAQVERWFFRLIAPECAYACDQFLRSKWFCQIIIHAELQSGYPILDLAAGSKQSGHALALVRRSAAERISSKNARARSAACAPKFVLQLVFIEISVG